MFKYQNLIDVLPVGSLESTIKELVNNIDMTGECYVNDVFSKKEEIFKKYFSPSEQFLKLIEETAQNEYDEINVNNLNDPDNLEFFCFFESSPDSEIERIKENIYSCILDYFASDAKIIANNREHLRISKGNIVDFDNCSLSKDFLGKVEFYKDGGWGIAEKDGKVIVKNHLTTQPSNTRSLTSIYNCPYRIIQDRDTNKYGVLSLASFYETIHCNFDKIEVVEYYTINENINDKIEVDEYFSKSEKHYFIKVRKDGKWGCFDENCALLVDCKYDEIIQRGAYFECARDGEFLKYDKIGRGYDFIFEGKRDLYNNEGRLLFGGYDNLEMEYGYFKFYFGTKYEEYYEEDTDFYDNTYKLTKFRLNYQNSVCLLLDEHFSSVISNKNGHYKLIKGTIFNTIEEVKRNVPSWCMLKYRVDLSDINDSFIYLNDFYGDEYIVPTYIVKGFHDPEEQGKHEEKVQKEHIKHLSELRKQLGLREDAPIKEAVYLPFDEEEIPLVIYDDYSRDIFFDNPMITIIKLNSNYEIEWVNYVNEVRTVHYVNEIIKVHYSNHIYRRGMRYGFYDGNSLKDKLFDAISLETPDNQIYVASYEYCNSIKNSNTQPNNPNLNKDKYAFIHYFRAYSDGRMIPVADNWDYFDPTKCKWIPSDFIERNYYVYHPSYDDCCHERNEYTDEDAWDAMTDGMYGDYPGSGWDPEQFGF